MNIAMILTNGFDPDPRVFKEAKSLVSAGHRVEVLCWDRSGKYKDKPEETMEGVRIVRFFGDAQYGSGYKQINKFLNFKRDILRYIENHTFQAIHCHDFDGFFIGYSINKKLKLKLIYDEHDLFYTYFSERKGVINKAITFTIKVLENHMLKKADAHIVVTPKMMEIYKAKSKNSFLVNNAPYKDTFKDIDKTESNKIRIGFIGSVRYYEEMTALIDAASKYKDSIDVIISGRGISLEKLKDYSKEHKNVVLTGGYTFSEIERLYKNIDITYAFYPSKEGAVSMPNKYFESIITGTPIIANKDTEFGFEVEKNKIGITVTQNNLREELNSAITKIMDDKNFIIRCKNNMEVLKNSCYWENNTEILKNLYKGLNT